MERGLRRRRLERWAFAFVAGATLICLGRLGWLAAELLTGGPLLMTEPGFDTAGSGTPSSGRGFSLQGSIGQFGVIPMSGGGFTLSPGLIAAQAQATTDLASVHAFPVPFEPSQGHSRITFRGLTANATVRIYTIAGQLVQTLSKNDPTTGDLVWYPVANSAGQAVASGVYPYVVDDQAGHKKLGKLMIIR
jgi:hypothetical protein